MELSNNNDNDEVTTVSSKKTIDRSGIRTDRTVVGIDDVFDFKSSHNVLTRQQQSLSEDDRTSNVCIQRKNSDCVADIARNTDLQATTTDINKRFADITAARDLIKFSRNDEATIHSTSIVSSNASNDGRNNSHLKADLDPVMEITATCIEDTTDGLLDPPSSYTPSLYDVKIYSVSYQHSHDKGWRGNVYLDEIIDEYLISHKGTKPKWTMITEKIITEFFPRHFVAKSIVRRMNLLYGTSFLRISFGPLQQEPSWEPVSLEFAINYVSNLMITKYWDWLYNNTSKKYNIDNRVTSVSSVKVPVPIEDSTFRSVRNVNERKKDKYYDAADQAPATILLPTARSHNDQLPLDTISHVDNNCNDLVPRDSAYPANDDRNCRILQDRRIDTSDIPDIRATKYGPGQMSNQHNVIVSRNKQDKTPEDIETSSSSNQGTIVQDCTNETNFVTDDIGGADGSKKNTTDISELPVGLDDFIEEIEPSVIAEITEADKQSIQYPNESRNELQHFNFTSIRSIEPSSIGSKQYLNNDSPSKGIQYKADENENSTRELITSPIIPAEQMKVVGEDETPTAIIPGPPPRPMTAYNIFFQLERQKILKEFDDGDDPLQLLNDKSASESKDDEDTEDAYLSELKSKRIPFTNDDIMDFVTRKKSSRDVNENKNKMLEKKRRHIKDHGKIGFQELSKLVAKRWRVCCTGDERTRFHKYYTGEMEKYKALVARYNQQQKELKQKQREENKIKKEQKQKEKKKSANKSVSTTKKKGSSKRNDNDSNTITTPNEGEDIGNETLGTAVANSVKSRKRMADSTDDGKQARKRKSNQDDNAVQQEARVVAQSTENNTVNNTMETIFETFCKLLVERSDSRKSPRNSKT